MWSRPAAGTWTSLDMESSAPTLAPVKPTTASEENQRVPSSDRSTAFGGILRQRCGDRSSEGRADAGGGRTKEEVRKQNMFCMGFMSCRDVWVSTLGESGDADSGQDAEVELDSGTGSSDPGKHRCLRRASKLPRGDCSIAQADQLRVPRVLRPAPAKRTTLPFLAYPTPTGLPHFRNCRDPPGQTRTVAVRD